MKFFFVIYNFQQFDPLLLSIIELFLQQFYKQFKQLYANVFLDDQDFIFFVICRVIYIL